MQILLAIYFLLFNVLAWRNFKLALGLFVIFLPTYLIRFELFGMPSNLLELSFGTVFLVWLIKYLKKDFNVIKKFVLENRLFSIFFGLFFLASIGGIFISDEWFKSAGHWRAFFLEPMLFFIMLLGSKKRIGENYLVLFLGLSTISISILAILQKFFPILYPAKLWDEEVFGRVTSFYTTPNAIGLYLVPILVLLAGYLHKSYKKNKLSTIVSRVLVLASIFAVIAICLSISQGAWIALGVGIVVFLYFIDYKKISISFVLIGLIFSLVVTPIRQAVLFQDISGQNRLTIWNYTTDYLTESPQNFVMGTGIRQWFRKIQKPYYFEENYNIERLTFPHNVFLNFWTEIGLFGILSFIGIMYFIFYWSYKVYKDDKIIGAGFIAMWIAFLIHGLVDVPYFKNDLAFLFWILIALTFYRYNIHSQLLFRVEQSGIEKSLIK